MSDACLFDVLTLKREIACPPERLFALMTDREARALWSAPSEDVVIEIDESDIRDGGREVARCGPKEAPDFFVVADFHLVEAPARLGLSETLNVGGMMLSVSLVTQEITPVETGSLLKVTLQIVSLSGPETFEGYGEGWNAALDSLARMAGAETVQ